MLAVTRFKPTRLNDRKPCRFSGEVTASYLMFNNWYDCEIMDVSDYGAAIKTKQFFVKNDILKLRIMFDNRSAVIDTVVTHHAGMTTGILFTDREEGRVAAFLGILDAALTQRIKKQAREFFRKLRN